MTQTNPNKYPSPGVETLNPDEGQRSSYYCFEAMYEYVVLSPKINLFWKKYIRSNMQEQVKNHLSFKHES